MKVYLARVVSEMKMGPGEGGTWGTTDIVTVKTESSIENPRVTGDLVSNCPHPRVRQFENNAQLFGLCPSNELFCDLRLRHLRGYLPESALSEGRPKSQSERAEATWKNTGAVWRLFSGAVFFGS